MIFFVPRNFAKNQKKVIRNGFLTRNSDSWPNLGGGSSNSHAIPAYGSNFRSGRSPGLPFFDQCFLDVGILGPLKAKFDQLDRSKIKNWSYLSYLHIFISVEMFCHEKTKFHFLCLFFLFFVLYDVLFWSSRMIDLDLLIDPC